MKTVTIEMGNFGAAYIEDSGTEVVMGDYCDLRSFKEGVTGIKVVAGSNATMEMINCSAPTISAGDFSHVNGVLSGQVKVGDFSFVRSFGHSRIVAGSSCIINVELGGSFMAGPGSSVYLAHLSGPNRAYRVIGDDPERTELPYSRSSCLKAGVMYTAGEKGVRILT